jgi:hypothetical protein
MHGRYVRSEKTPLAFDEAARVVRAALARKLGWGPARPVLALTLARTALETSRWQALYDHNFGNSKLGEAQLGMFTCRACSVALESGQTWFIPEGELDQRDGCVSGKVWLVPPGHPQTRFRAFADATEGAEHYVAMLSSGRDPLVWESLLLGDAIGYARALKLNGYFASDELAYGSAIVDLQDEFWHRLEGLPASEVALPDRESVEAMIAYDADVFSLNEEPDVAGAHSGKPATSGRDSGVELFANEGEVPSSEPPGRVA